MTLHLCCFISQQMKLHSVKPCDIHLTYAYFEKRQDIEWDHVLPGCLCKRWGWHNNATKALPNRLKSMWH